MPETVIRRIYQISFNEMHINETVNIFFRYRENNLQRVQQKQT
jgi:hypothetical protein